MPAYLNDMWPFWVNSCGGGTYQPGDEAPPGGCIPVEYPLWQSIPVTTLVILPPLLVTIHLIRKANRPGGPHPATRPLTFSPREKPDNA